MQPVLEKVKVPTLVIIIFFACLYLFTKVLGPLPLSVNSVSTMKNNFFTVQGVGEEKAVADTAMVSLGVVVHAPTAEEAKSQMNAITNKVVADLKALGIEEKDIKTTNFSVYEDTTPQPLSAPADDVMIERPTLVGPKAPSTNSRIVEPVITTKPLGGKTFTGSQNIEVRAKSIELANKAIDVATADGANALGTPQFVVNEETRKALVKKARKKAIADAKQKATELANEAGIKLGKVVDVQESSGGGMYYAKDMAMSAQPEGAPTQLNPGEDTISVSVSLSYETL